MCQIKPIQFFVCVHGVYVCIVYIYTKKRKERGFSFFNQQQQNTHTHTHKQASSFYTLHTLSLSLINKNNSWIRKLASEQDQQNMAI